VSKIWYADALFHPRNWEFTKINTM